ncbi:MAG: hypothetical protein Q4Q00_13555, partial [Turicibacter sp.]|nr:hypothetical protein [Turicibacter sp.]
KDIPSNCVYAENPAKFICSIDEYYEKKKSRNVDAAFFRARYIFDTKKRMPTMTEMQWFCLYFLDRNVENEKFLRTLPFKADDMEEVIKCYYNSTPIFKDYKDFLTKAFPNIEVAEYLKSS